MITIDSLSDYCSQIRMIRGYFESWFPVKGQYIDQVDQVLHKYTSITSRLEIHKKEIQHPDSIPQIIHSDESDILTKPLIFKVKDNRTISYPHTYIYNHFKNSVMRDIIKNNEREEKYKLNQTVFSLYYYWFFRKDNIEDVGASVYTTLEDLIESVIGKVNTLYKDHNPDQLIEDLRWRLKVEKLNSTGEQRVSMNLRR